MKHFIIYVSLMALGYGLKLLLWIAERREEDED